MLLMLAGGTEYMFSTYSTDLKHLLGYNQTQINFLGRLEDILKFF